MCVSGTGIGCVSKEETGSAVLLLLLLLLVLVETVLLALGLLDCMIVDR